MGGTDVRPPGVTYPPAPYRAASAQHLTSLHLAGETLSVRRAREFVRRSGAEFGFQDTTCQTAALLTSEAVTNVFLHAGAWALLTVTGASGGLLVEVEDSGDPRTLLAGPEDLGMLGGRGLHIVAELATGCGTYPTEQGKVYWFHLAGPALAAV